MKKLLPLFVLSALVLVGCTKTSVDQLNDSNNYDSDPIADVTDDRTTMASGSKISITNANNESLFSYTLKQSCNQLIFSSPDMVNGGKYTIYSGSTSVSTITLSGTLTKVGSSQGGGPGGSPGGGW